MPYRIDARGDDETAYIHLEGDVDADTILRAVDQMEEEGVRGWAQLWDFAGVSTFTLQPPDMERIGVSVIQRASRYGRSRRIAAVVPQPTFNSIIRVLAGRVRRAGAPFQVFDDAETAWVWLAGRW